MGRNKIYKGYHAFKYLEPGIDYREFKRAKEIDRVEPYVVPLSKAEEERAEQLIEKNICISLHDHPTVHVKDLSDGFLHAKEGREFTAYEGLSVSGLDAIFDNLMDGSSYITSKKGWKWTDVVYDLGMRLSDLAHQNFIIHCKKADDIVKAHETGRLAMIFVVESCTPIENEVDRLDILFGLGIRSMGLTYSQSNMLGSGLSERRDGGLTDFGYDCVKRMNKIGMLIDVSHCGNQTALDAIESSEKPILISHCGSQTITPTTRMLPDSVLQAMAEKGGVVGIETAGWGHRTKKNPDGDIEGFMEQVEYCMDLLGASHIGIGPDTLYGDHTGVYVEGYKKRNKGGSGHYARPWKAKPDLVQHDAQKQAYEDPEFYVKGLENPSDYPNVIRWLVKHGYSDSDIVKVAGANAMRVLREVWPAEKVRL